MTDPSRCHIIKKINCKHQKIHFKENLPRNKYYTVFHGAEKATNENKSFEKKIFNSNLQLDTSFQYSYETVSILKQQGVQIS